MMLNKANKVVRMVSTPLSNEGRRIAEMCIWEMSRYASVGGC